MNLNALATDLDVGERASANANPLGQLFLGEAVIVARLPYRGADGGVEPRMLQHHPARKSVKFA